MSENPYESPRFVDDKPRRSSRFLRPPTLVEWLVIAALAIFAAILFLLPDVDDGTSDVLPTTLPPLGTLR